MEHKKKLFKRIILGNMILVFSAYTILYYLFWPSFRETLLNIEAFSIITGIIFMRVFIFLLMTYILFRQWIKQESIYTSDAYFLFGTTFIILIAGKLFDLFYNFIHASGSFSEDFTFNLLKIRYLIIILNVIPLLYLGLQVLITLVKVYIKDLSKQQFNRIRLAIIIVFLSVISLLIIFTNERAKLYNLLPVIVSGTMIGIVVMFLFMYKNKHLSQAHGLIIGAGFILAILFSFVRIILLLTFDETLTIIYSEIFDMIAYSIIFTGFILKPKYAKEKIVAFPEVIIEK